MVFDNLQEKNKEFNGLIHLSLAIQYCSGDLAIFYY